MKKRRIVVLALLLLSMAGAGWFALQFIRDTPDVADRSRVQPESDAPVRGQPEESTTDPVARPPSTAALPPVADFSLSRFDDVALDRDPDFGTPHFIRRRAGFLSPPAPDAEPQAILAAFIEANARTLTLHPSDLEGLNAYVTRDYRGGGMRHVRWQQRHEDLDIFGARLALNLTDDHRIVNVSSRALYIPSVRFHRDEQIGEDEAMRIAREELGGGDLKHAYRVRRVWYPLDMISTVLSWEVAIEVHGNPEAHDFVIRADTGEIVFDQSLTWGLEDLSLHVFTDDSPAPFTPGPDAPTNNLPVEVAREWLTLPAIDTNASPEGWVPDGSNELLGNNADVYADRNDNDAPDGPRVVGNPYRVFDEAVDLDLYPDAYIPFSQVQGFYTLNAWHDWTHALGFDEAAGNFQQDNFGRGGSGLDRMKLEVQNGADLGFPSANQAWYTGFGDGFPGRVSVSIFGRSTPHRCGALDAVLVLHEATHGLTSRLVDDGYGLTKVQSRGMAEGWSDFFALTLLSEPGDDPHATYPLGGYAGLFDDDPTLFYYGLRRFPYSTDMTRAPQTFADADPNQMSFPAGVPRNPSFGSAEADQIHNLGEIWCLALWECRADLIGRYGFAGNERMMRLVVDGLKLTPPDPRFDQARDAILQADLVANGGTNAVTLWEGFARRGLGWSAQVPEPQSTVGIVEAFDLPFGIEATATETSGDGDGFVEPGESATLSVLLTSHELDLTGVTATLTSQSSNVTVVAGSAAFPDLAAGGSAEASPLFAFDVDSAFGGFTDALFTLQVAADKGAFEETIAVRIGNPGDYPPEITGIIVTDVTETNATVQWSTGIPSDGFVRYGLTTNYAFATPLDPVLRTNHAAELTNLVKGTDYYFQVVSQGSNGLVGVSADQTFRTRSRIYVWVDSPAAQELGTIEAPYKTLQAAAEEAKMTGDEILVAEGVYTGTDPDGVLDLDGVEYDLTITGAWAPDFLDQDPAYYETLIDGEMQRRGISLDNGAVLSLQGVTIANGFSEYGGGVHVRKSELLLSSCLLLANTSTNGINPFGGGAYATLGSLLSVSSSVICSNLSNFGGGVRLVSTGTRLEARGTQFCQNQAKFGGGGIQLILGATCDVAGCLLWGNSSIEASGGGIDINPFCEVNLATTTITSNEVIAPNQPAFDGGGGVQVAGSASGPALLTATAVIVYDNKSQYGNDLRVRGVTEVHLSYSIVGELFGALTSSNHVLHVDPLFARPDVGDFHILNGSPCIEAGPPDYPSSEIDIDGEPRPFGASIDIGVDEFTDVDADNMADYWEAQQFGNLAASDGTGNDDNDGLADFEEYLEQTDPFDADTDDDLGDDGFEVGLGMDPLDPDADQDGMWDGWEAHNGLDWTLDDAGLNPDSDTMNNLAEFVADTGPFDPASFLGFSSISRFLWFGTRIDWHGGTQAWQILEQTPTLASTNVSWQPLLAFPPPTPLNHAVVIWDDDDRFYRIRAQRQPPAE